MKIHSILKLALLGLCIQMANCQTSKPQSITVDKIIEKTPRALEEYKDFIGLCNCKSVLRDQQGQWKDTVNLTWSWKYIMEGQGVMDEGWYSSEGITHRFTSIRVYDTINKQWYVSYFTPNLNSLPETWVGGKTGQDIVLKKEQPTAQGPMESVLTFYNISEKGFDWEGKVVSKEKKVDYSFWKIWCRKEAL